jgi:polynucleotide 5'-kinase involved in rRNA processing
LCQGIQAFFAGAATPATHPALYTASVAAAFDAYCEMIREDVTPAPLLVNSHGWVTGAPSELLRWVKTYEKSMKVHESTIFWLD